MPDFTVLHDNNYIWGVEIPGHPLSMYHIGSQVVTTTHTAIQCRWQLYILYVYIIIYYSPATCTMIRTYRRTRMLNACAYRWSRQKIMCLLMSVHLRI